jgi:hypothetical protein
MRVSAMSDIPEKPHGKSNGDVMPPKQDQPMETVAANDVAILVVMLQ